MTVSDVPSPLAATPVTALADALAARLCHDLSGPAGTVAGMLELHDPARDPPDGTLDLAREATGQLLRRLKLARAAWAGAADWEAGALAGLAALAATDRLHVRLDATSLALGRAPALGRLLLNVVLLGEETLGGRGAVAIEAGEARALRAVLSPARAWPCLPPSDDAALLPEEPGRFQAAFTLILARAAGMELQAAEARLLIRPAT